MCTARKGIHTAFICVLAVCTALQATPTLDLTGSATSEAIGGVVFRQFDPEPAGMDYLRCCIRRQDEAQVSPRDDTGGRRLSFDANTSSEWVQSLRLRDVPIVDPGSTDYRRFLLAISTSSATQTNPFSLDKLEIYLGAAGSLLESPSFAGKVYRLAEAARQ